MGILDATIAGLIVIAVIAIILVLQSDIEEDDL